MSLKFPASANETEEVMAQEDEIQPVFTESPSAVPMGTRIVVTSKNAPATGAVKDAPKNYRYISSHYNI